MMACICMILLEFEFVEIVDSIMSIAIIWFMGKIVMYTVCTIELYVQSTTIYFILYSENQCISKYDKIGIFIDMKFH